jgi:hypothetical protein
MGAGKTTYTLVQSAAEPAQAPAQEQVQAQEANPPQGNPPQENQPQGTEPPRLKKPEFKKLSKLDRLLERINSSEAPKVFEGDELTAKKNEIVDRMIDVVVRVNSGITSLSERIGYGIIDPDTDQIALIRDDKGVTASYSNDGGRTTRVLFFESWPKAMTERWCESAIARLERQAVDMLGRMTQYCLKKNGCKKR